MTKIKKMKIQQKFKIRKCTSYIMESVSTRKFKHIKQSLEARCT
jgi:hypothetical protein